jgi:hypothetical protein
MVKTDSGQQKSLADRLWKIRTSFMCKIADPGPDATSDEVLGTIEGSRRAPLCKLAAEDIKSSRQPPRRKAKVARKPKVIKKVVEEVPTKAAEEENLDSLLYE